MAENIVTRNGVPICSANLSFFDKLQPSMAQFDPGISASL